MASFNCECLASDPGRPLETMAALRQKMGLRCGFAAQAANLPVGQAAEFNEYLRAAQAFIYDKVASYKIERFYRWSLVEGERFYDIDANRERTGETPECNAIFSPDHLIWVGIARGSDPLATEIEEGSEWFPLVNGVPPEAYSGGPQTGWPSNYEIRQCIELYPAPAADGGFLVIKARMALMPFVADTDKTTIDSELVLMQAIAMWRTDKGKPGARELTNMVISRIGDLTAGTHGTRRYIPGAFPWVSPARPVLVGGFIE